MIRLPLSFGPRYQDEAGLTEMLQLEELLTVAEADHKQVVLSITNETGTHTFYPKVYGVGEVEQA